MSADRTRELEGRIAALEEELAGFRSLNSPAGWPYEALGEVIDSLPMLVYAKDREGRFTRVNVGFARKMGRQPEELRGVSCREQFPEFDRHCGAVDEEVMRTGVPILGREMQFPFPGGMGWVIVNKLPMHRPDGTVDGLVSVALDITGQKQIEARLRASEARFRSIFENAGIGMADLGIDGVYRRANTAFCQIMAMREPEIVGRHYRDLTHGDDLAKLERQVERLVSGEIISLTSEKRNIRGDGSVIWVRTIDTLILDHVGVPAGFITLLQDISQRKLIEVALSESEETARAVLNSFNESGMLIDPDGTVIEANDTFSRRVGVPAEQLRGRCIYDYFDAEVAESRRRRVNSLLESSDTGSIRFIDQRSNRWIENIVFPIRTSTGAVRRMVIMGFDITERIETEQRLVQLADELAGRTAELEQANRRLQQSNSDLEAFAYTVSHDLKSPLELMKGCISIVLDDHGEIIDPEVRDLLARASDAGSRMQQLITDLLWFSRSNSLELRREPVNLSWLAGEVAARAVFPLPSPRPHVDIAEGLTAEVDESLMRVALENLIGNAVKFSRLREDAHIEFGAREEGSQLVYFVRDNGVGFEQEHAARLFEPFFRLHDRSRFEGSGIGLATVRRVIERHNGRIWAEGTPGEGSVFKFTVGS